MIESRRSRKSSSNLTRSRSLSPSYIPSETTPIEHNESAVRTGPVKIAIGLLCFLPLLFLRLTEQQSNTRWLPDVEADGHRHKPENTVTNHRSLLENSLRSETGTLSRADVKSFRNNADEVSDVVFLDRESQVMVAIVLTDTQQWIVANQNAYATPGSVLLTPLSHGISASDAPFRAAQRITNQLVGIEVEEDAKDDSVARDELGVPDGSVPEELKEHWTLLGRYRNSADAGAGFTYTYLFRTASDSIRASPEAPKVGDDARHFLLTQREIQEALLNGDFQEIRGAATIGLALQHAGKGHFVLEK